MNKKLLISAFLFFILFSFMLLSQEESKEKKIWEDERISITVDKVERADSFPERLRQRNATYQPPKKGHDFVLIHISVDEKKDLKTEVTDLRTSQPNSPHLIDDQGKTHWTVFMVYKIPPGTVSLYGNEGFMLFEIPKEATLVQLKFVYPYRGESPKPKEIKYGQIDIDLSHIQ